MLKYVERNWLRLLRPGFVRSKCGLNPRDWLGSPAFSTKSNHVVKKYPVRYGWRNLSTLASCYSASGGGTEVTEGGTEFECDSDLDALRLEGGQADESNQYLFTILYPNSTDPVISSILESTTVHQLFTTMESISDKDWTPEQCAQALSTLWDLHKLMFQIGTIFDSDQASTCKQSCIRDLVQNSTFQKILTGIVSNVEKLQDEPIAASLLSLKKFDFSIRSNECQVLLTELEKRKETLPLPAISRICVVLRNEGLYGAVFTASLFNRLAQLVQTVGNGHDLRLVSISLRNAARPMPPSLIQSYYDRVDTLLKTGQLQNIIDPSIYCKILLCINDTKWIPQSRFDLNRGSPQELTRVIGHLLAPKVKDLSFVDVLSLQRVLEYSAQEPPDLIAAINARIGREIEQQQETPGLEVFSCLSPSTRRTLVERTRLSWFVQEHLNMPGLFPQAYDELLRVIRVLKLNSKADSGRIYQKFWDRAGQHLRVESDDPTVVLKMATDYLTSSNAYVPRHLQFEATAKELLYFYIDNYKHRLLPTFVSPGDFAKAYAFLLAYSWHAEPIFQENTHGLWAFFHEKFIKGVRPLDILTLSRGITASLSHQSVLRNPRCTSRCFDQIQNFVGSLNAAMNDFVLGDRHDDTTLSELVYLTKAQSILKQVSEQSLVFKTTMDLITERATMSNFDSKGGRDLVSTLAVHHYNDPPSTNFLLNFVTQHRNSVSQEFAHRFLSYAYNIGLETRGARDASAFQALGDVLLREWETVSSYALVQSCLMLSLAQALQPPLVQRVFSTYFLNRLDEDCKSSWNSSFSQRLRKAYMELNRAVCLGLPDANVPWFHQKYCESLYSVGPVRETPLLQEVVQALSAVLNDEAPIQTNVESPYFYNMNCLIEFDETGKPLKKDQGRALVSLKSLRKGPTTEGPKVAESVAVLILPENAFAQNARSLRGYFLLRKRHLEIIGYRVIHIDPQHWNSMHMTDQGRADFLERAIFAKSQDLSTQTLPTKGSQPTTFDLI